MKRSTLLASLVLVLTVARVASADEPVAGASDSDKLFAEGVQLIDKGNYAEACPKLRKSQELDPAVGTQFYIAGCLEREGKQASAYNLYREVQRAAHAAGKSKLEDNARARADALDAKVTRVKLRFEERMKNVLVTVDGVAVVADVQSPLPVDAGEHAIEVSAGGRKTWSTRVSVVDGAGEMLVAVPRLEEDKKVVTTAVEAPRSVRRTIALVAAGASVLALGAGTYFGLRAMSERDTARDLCGTEEPLPCKSPDGVSAWKSASDAGNVSTITFAIGAALGVGAGVLWFTAPKPKVGPVGIAASLGPRDGSIVLDARF